MTLSPFIETSPPHAQAPNSQVLGALAWSRVKGVASGVLKGWLEQELCLLSLWQQPFTQLPASIKAQLGVESLNHWAQLKTELDPLALWEQAEAKGVRLCLWGQATYPAWLAEIHQPPVLLYVRGALEVLHQPGLGVVGTRQASAYGLNLTRRLVEGLADSGLPIVSGLAKGIDAEAHHAALAAGLPTVAVLGCGVDVVYPKTHEALTQAILKPSQGPVGAVVSELPLGTQPQAQNFPRRNRMISGLSQGVVVVECPLRSGAMSTARYALEDNRSLMAVPGDVDAPNSAGPLSLLRQGALPVWQSQHIVEEFNLEAGKQAAKAAAQQSGRPTKPRKPSTTSADEPSKRSHSTVTGEAVAPELAALLAVIPFEGIEFDALSQVSGLQVDDLQNQLTWLELDAWIQTEAGGRLRRIKR